VIYRLHLGVPQYLKMAHRHLNFYQLAEVVVIVEEGVANLKVDHKVLDKVALNKCSVMTEVRC
jgi:hypothetical protein